MARRRARDKKQRKRDRYYDDVDCHICGLPIPPRTLTVRGFHVTTQVKASVTLKHKHALYGTRDHVIPKSRGGKNHPENVLPAHRICNVTRGNLDLTETLRLSCRTLVIREFSLLRISRSYSSILHESRFMFKHGIFLGFKNRSPVAWIPDGDSWLYAEKVNLPEGSD